MSIEDDLLKKTESEYGDSYKLHCLEIYKLYVEMVDRISTRRQSANTFFLSLNTAIVGLVGYVQLASNSEENADFYWLIGLAGMVICYLWYRLVKSYKDINSGKFKVIHKIEQKLPLAPYDAEWEALGRGQNPKLYLPFTRVEMGIPWVFFVLHLFVFIRVFFA